MKKFITGLMLVMSLFLVMPQEASAGVVNGKVTKIRTYTQANKVYFESRIPNVSIIVRKVDVIKGMTKIGKTRTIVEIQRDGLIIDIDKKVGATLDRVGDGLHIRTNNLTMFITEKELDDVRKLR